MSDNRPVVPRWLLTAAAVSGRFLVVAAAIVVAVLLLAELRLAVLPVLIALLLATLLAPPAAWLKRRGAPPALAASLVVVAAVVGFFGLFGVLIPTVITEFRGFGDELAEGWDDLVEWLTEGPLAISAGELSQLLDQAVAQARENAAVIGTGVLSGAVLAIELVAGLLLALVLLFFFVKDGERIVGWLLERLPQAHRDDISAAGRRAWATLGGYLRGMAIVALVDAAGIGIGLWVIGVPLALPLAVLTFFGGFFPIIGATVAGLVAVLVAFVAGGWVDALLVLALVVAVQQLESNLLQPVVMSRAVRLHPTVILFVIVSGGVLAGIVGAFLAVPVTAVASAVGNELRLRREQVARQPPPATPSEPVAGPQATGRADDAAGVPAASPAGGKGG